MGAERNGFALEILEEQVLAKVRKRLRIIAKKDSCDWSYSEEQVLEISFGSSANRVGKF